MKVKHTALAPEACAVHREVYGEALSRMGAGPVKNVRPEHRDGFTAVVNDANAYFDGNASAVE